MLQQIIKAEIMTARPEMLRRPVRSAI